MFDIVGNILKSNDCSQLTDSELLKSFKSGDDSAFTELISRYEQQLIAYLYHLTSDLELSRDICQDCFIKLIKSPPLFLVKNSLKSWLFRTARNQAFDYMRRLKRHQSYEHRNNQPENNSHTPHNQLKQSDDYETFKRHLDSLSDDLKDIVSLRIYANMSFKEIAALRRIPLGTALWRMQKATKLLRQAIEREDR